MLATKLYPLLPTTPGTANLTSFPKRKTPQSATFQSLYINKNGRTFVKSHIVYRLCNHMVYKLSLILPRVIVQEIAFFECVNSLVQVDAADSELPEH